MSCVEFLQVTCIVMQLCSELNTQELALDNLTGSKCETVSNNKVKHNDFKSEKHTTNKTLTKSSVKMNWYCNNNTRFTAGYS